MSHKRDENEEQGRIHNEKLHSFHRSRNIVRVIKCRRLKWRKWKNSGVL